MSRFPFLAALFACLVAAHAGEPHPSLPPPVIPDCLGVNIHFTDPKPGELEMIAAAGFKWVRMDFGWGGIERVKGEYDFSAFDRLAASLDKFHMRAVFILDYGNPLYANPGETTPFTARANTPEFRAAFTKWAVAAVQHFKGRGYLWEMWNEPNGGFWKSADKTGDYIALAKSTGEALNQAGLLGPKGEAFIGPATSTIDLPYLEACFKAGLLDYWDAVSVHPYRQNAPETVEDEYRSLRLLIRKYAPKDKNVPIISGEWGYSSAWSSLGKDEAARAELQGKYLPREFLTNIANDVALSIWYDWHDDGADPIEGEHRFGIVGNEYHPGHNPVYDPKPAYTAMKTLTDQLGGYRFNKREGIGGIDRTLLFEKGQEIRAVYWNTKRFKGELPLVRDDATFDIFDWSGKKIDFVPGKPESHGFFGDVEYISPVDALDVRHFQFMAAVQRLPLEYYVHVPANLTINAAIRNPFAEPLSFDLETRIPSLEPLLEDAVVKVDEIIPPRFILGSHSMLTECKTFRIDDPSPALLVWQSFFTDGDAPGAWRVIQRPLVIVTNSIEIEEVGTGPDFVLFRLLNPSGEPIRGTVNVELNGATGFAGSLQNFDVETQAGQREMLFRAFVNPELGTAFEKGQDWRAYRRVRLFMTAKEKVSSRMPSLSLPVDFDLLTHAVVKADGDAKVSSEATVAAAEPFGIASPLGTLSVRLSYHADAGWKFFRLTPAAGGKLEIQPSLKATPQSASWSDPSKFALWLYGDGKGCQARIRFTDSTGQTFQSDGTKIDWKGWRYVTFPLSPSEIVPLTHWGGANDGVVHAPIQWDSLFLLDNASREPVEGEIYLSAPTLIY